MQFRVYGRPGLLGWLRMLIALVVLLAVGLAIAIVAIGVFIFLLPVVLVSALVFYFVLRSRLRRAGYRQPEGAHIIEGEYSVVDGEDGPPPGTRSIGTRTSSPFQGAGTQTGEDSTPRDQ